MTIIVFLIDNTASMNQRCSSGPTFLDLAKGAVETFLKFRSRDPSSRGVDRYMLLTFEEMPKNIKAGWKESHITLMQELKNLKATGSSTIGQALGHTLHFLNVNRLQSGIDNFGFGRYPSFLEPVVILLITDGCHLKPSNAGLSTELDIPRSSLPGSELYIEPYRWDQRIFGIVLRIPGQNTKIADAGTLLNDIPEFEATCEATGGRSFCITSQKLLNQCMENLVQRVQTGVVVVFEKVGPDPQQLESEKKHNNGDDSLDVSAEHKLRHIVENGFVQQNERFCDDAATQPLLLDAQNESSDSISHASPDANERSSVVEENHIERASLDKKQSTLKNNVIKCTNNSRNNVDSKAYFESKTVSFDSKTVCVGNNADLEAKTNEGVNKAWHINRTVLYVPRTAGRGCAPSHWPLPEPFCPDPASNTLPSRCAQVVLKFRCEPCEPPTNINDLPYDKYELEPCPLTQFILERKQSTTCWQVFVAGSSRTSELGQPFGYVKPASGLNSVNLFVLAYNYPVLLQLLDEFRNVLNSRPNNLWRAKFEKYFRAIPPYYLGPLKKILARCQFNVQPEIPVTGFLSYSVLSNLGRIKQKGKEEFDKLCQTVLANQQLQAQQNQLLCGHSGLKIISRLVNCSKTVPTGLFENIDLSAEARLKAKDPLLFTNEFPNFRLHIALKSKVRSSVSGAANENIDPCFPSDQIKDLRLFNQLDSHILNQKTAQQLFRNPFDIPRCKLLQQIQKMRVNLSQYMSSSALPVLEGGLPGTRLKLQDAEELHRLPVGQMGNYQDYLKVMPPPLKPLETQAIRQHAFGNPFKVDKRMLVDEADLDISLPTSGSSSVAQSLNNSSSSASLSTPKLMRKSYSDSNLLNSLQSGPGRPGVPKNVVRPQKRKAGPLPRDFSYKKFRRSVESSSASFSPSVSDYVESLPDVVLVKEELANETADDVSMEEYGASSHNLSICESPFDENIFSKLAESKIADDDQKATCSDAYLTSSSPQSALAAALENEAAKPKKRPKLAKSAAKISEEPVKPEIIFDLKRNLSTLIKMPRCDIEAISSLINSAPLITRAFLVTFGKAEAVRFKRVKLVELIEQSVSRSVRGSISRSKVER